MANLLLERLHYQRMGDVAGLRAKFDYLTKTQQHHYTSSELLNVRPLSKKVKDEVQQLIDREAPKYILPPYCSTDSFQASVEDYLSDKPCEDLHPSSMWHMAVAEQLLHQELRRPVLDLCWDSLGKESWQSLMSNATKLLDMLHREEAGLGLAESDIMSPTLIFNCNLSLLAIGGINAHSDIISPRAKHLIEIKTPMNPFKRNGGGVGKALVVKNENPWWIQALTYAVLCPVSIPVHKVSVVNLTAGEMFSLNVLNAEHPCPEGIPVPVRMAVLKKIFVK
ncbi:hypothetical protein HaLaN_17660 [Haematococcus lacustris]|uniref:Uncharacterized protein n=1 Tax=Haematococcus lacustris TaxID=44745 RepID=A0A699ZX50_HAELA|nr:hypothetical protein HaLaN_17660 [Haematococcus lacustris]